MEGVKVLQAEGCDFVMSFGGGSPHDCAKGIALVAANGGNIKDYEGVNVSKKPQLPLIAINTTAGTASEMTIFAIITDEERHVKMAIVDKHVNQVLRRQKKQGEWLNSQKTPCIICGESEPICIDFHHINKELLF